MPPSYHCQVCGTLALPTNSNLTDGNRFVHRACKPDLDRILEANPEWDDQAQEAAK